MIYELGKPEDLQAVYNVVQHTIKTIYPKYYPMEVIVAQLSRQKSEFFIMN